MYKVNDYIVYKRDVCKVLEIKENYFKGLDYYVLSPINDLSLKIQVPVNNGLLRDVIDINKVEEIINSIPSIDIIDIDSKLIESEYKKLLNSNKYEDLIRIIKTSYLRNKEREDNKRKVSDKDKYYFDMAEKFLYSEFSIVLNMSYDDTKEYVINKVKGIGV